MNFRWNFIGSETEERDVRKAYLGGNGCMNFMMDSVPFMTVEDEPRIIKLVKGLLTSLCFLFKRGHWHESD